MGAFIPFTEAGVFLLGLLGSWRQIAWLKSLRFHQRRQKNKSQIKVYF